MDRACGEGASWPDPGREGAVVVSRSVISSCWTADNLIVSYGFYLAKEKRVAVMPSQLINHR